jgi:hypothetical protein
MPTANVSQLDNGWKYVDELLSELSSHMGNVGLVVALSFGYTREGGSLWYTQEGGSLEGVWGDNVLVRVLSSAV